MKITIEQDGKQPEVIETNEFFLYTDKGASWKGVETNISKMLGIYIELLDNVVKKRMFTEEELKKWFFIETKDGNSK